MKDTILFFESRDLCYESNRYFVECMAEAFEYQGYPVEICDLSIRMEEKLEALLSCQEKYLLAVDFNSLLPRMELEDGTPYLDVFKVPFYNYLVDHPLYHHIGLKKSFPAYSVICIDTCHQEYIKKYYPHIKDVFYLPIGAMRAKMERSFDQKRLELLFLGTYEPEDKLYQELEDYPQEKRREISALIEMMEADPALTQEDALLAYLKRENEETDVLSFAKRLNGDYLADKYLRNLNRKRAVLAAAGTKVPFTVIGHGWEEVKGLSGKHIQLRRGVGFAASIQIMADAKMLLNSTPGFHGGLHDRVYSAMINRTLCFTEESGFSKQKLSHKENAMLYDVCRPDALAGQITHMYENPGEAEQIAERAFWKAYREETWEQRIVQFRKEERVP